MQYLKIISSGICSLTAGWIACHETKYLHAESELIEKKDEVERNPPRIAIIGSGIGGASASHYIR